MSYKFIQDRENYEKYAAGAVFYAAPGHTAFPIRLANEVFQRCMAIREAEGQTCPCILYDPCCGGAYHLATMAYFNWNRIEQIYASDIDPHAISIAARNLSLLSLDGLDRRIQELLAMAQEFGKPSHSVAHENALSLRERLLESSRSHRIQTHLFWADATNKAAIVAGLPDAKVDTVITDIPYGKRSHWHPGTSALASEGNPLHQMLESLLPVLSPGAIVAVAAAKTEKIAHERYRRAQKLKLGNRQVVFLTPTET